MSSLLLSLLISLIASSNRLIKIYEDKNIASPPHNNFAVNERKLLSPNTTTEQPCGLEVVGLGQIQVTTNQSNPVFSYDVSENIQYPTGKKEDLMIDITQNGQEVDWITEDNNHTALDFHASPNEVRVVLVV